MNLIDLVKAGAFFKVNLKTSNELFEFLGKELEPIGYVKDTFVEAIKEREEKYPTGILTDVFPVALPHVDAEHIITNAIVICHLEEEIPFVRMDDTNETLKAKLAFVMLISDVKNHTKAISELVKVFTTQGYLQKLYNASSHEEVIKIVEEIFQK